MIWLDSIPYYLGGLMALWIVRVTVIVFRYRAINYIVVRPMMTATPAAAIHQLMRQVIADSLLALSPLGYHIVANGCCPNFASGVAWWQIVFLNETTFDRVSVMCSLFRKKLRVSVVAVTEVVGQSNVYTQIGETKVEQLPAALLQLMTDHAAAVSQLPATVTRVRQPEMGREMEWLSEKAALIAASEAKRLGYARFGPRYLPTYRQVILSTWRSWPIVRFVAQRNTRRVGHAFEPIMQPKPVPLQTDESGASASNP